MIERRWISPVLLGISKITRWKFKVREGREPPKKKPTTFKVTPSIMEDDESDEVKEEEFAMLVDRGKSHIKNVCFEIDI